MEGETQAITLGVQLGASAAAVLGMTMVHGGGLLAILRGLRLQPEALENRSITARSLLHVGAFGVSLFGLHLFEISLFAGFYLLVGALQSVEEALYFSASAYATLGRTEEFFPTEWRLLGAIEALIGFVLISWSTAFIVSTINHLRSSPED